MISVYRKIGRRLRKYRRLARLKQVVVAKKLNLEGNALISNWERGKSIPNLEQAIQLTKLYKTSFSQLFWDLDQFLGNELFQEESNDFKNGP
jgi:transcriptional regulator with XRE-family HTH domain